MTIILIVGRQGAGKSLVGVALAIRYHQFNVKILTSDLELTGIPYKNFNPERALKEEWFWSWSGLVIIDDADIFIDSRGCMSRLHGSLYRWATGSRKRKNTLILIPHGACNVDKRYFKEIDFVLSPHPNLNETGDIEGDYLPITVETERSKYEMALSPISPIFQFYNSWGNIRPIKPFDL